MRLIRSITVLIAALLLMTLQPLPAFAAPPSNDTIGGATIVSLGFSQELDTTEATTDTDDSQLNGFCSAPATDASVWYSFTPVTDTGVIVDVSQSDYSAGVLVGVGIPGNLQVVACGPDTVQFMAVAGTTYYILAIDDQFGGGNGGTLRISISEAPLATVDITVDPVGRLEAGVAYVSGTYTCTGSDFISVSGQAWQTIGVRATVSGNFSFYEAFTCDGAVHTWSAAVFPIGGKFAGGKALTVTFGFICGSFNCADDYVEQTVKLRGGKL